MMTRVGRAVVEQSQIVLDLCGRTLKQVLTGKMGPVDRRIRLINRRRNLLFGSGDSGLLTNGNAEDSESEGEPESQDGQRVTIELDESVEIETESLSEEQLLTAALLDEQYPGAERIAISSEDTIEVQGSSRGKFVVEVSEVLEREFGGSPETNHRDSSLTGIERP